MVYGLGLGTIPGTAQGLLPDLCSEVLWVVQCRGWEAKNRSHHLELCLAKPLNSLHLIDAWGVWEMFWVVVGSFIFFLLVHIECTPGFALRSYFWWYTAIIWWLGIEPGSGSYAHILNDQNFIK